MPPRTGLYRAVATLPGGATQEIRWMVYDDNPEEKEVATDTPYLRALCEASGGRVLAPDELPNLLDTLQNRPPTCKPKERTTSVWDRAWVFYLACFALAFDWYLRRKWGYAEGRYNLLTAGTSPSRGETRGGKSIGPFCRASGAHQGRQVEYSGVPRSQAGPGTRPYATGRPALLASLHSGRL